MALDSITLSLPNEPHFRTFLQYHDESPDRTIFDDRISGNRVTFKQFLRDVHATRQDLLGSLPDSMVNNGFIITEERPYIFLLTPGNYEFAVAAFAALSIGGAIVPLSEYNSPDPWKKPADF